ncbi:hypothetical protein JOE11_005185 [Robbsia andropogonis]|uniref:hypothetical protein n=1 Tax=Robbsia andropogonis TaxID=28092 RepID=UPI003D241A03
MSEYKLTTEILARSEASTWDSAKAEWALRDVYESDLPQTCLCGHFPIIEICSIGNRLNGKAVEVGNCCVKKFIGLPSDKIFQAVKRIRKDSAKSLNAEAIGHAHDKGWINTWERDFYLNNMRKRNLSEKQAQKKTQINEKVIHHMQRRPPPKA